MHPKTNAPFCRAATEVYSLLVRGARRRSLGDADDTQREQALGRVIERQSPRPIRPAGALEAVPRDADVRHGERERPEADSQPRFARLGTRVQAQSWRRRRRNTRGRDP